MRIAILAAALAVVTSHAFATGSHPVPPPPSVPHLDSSSNATAASVSAARSDASSSSTSGALADVDVAFAPELAQAQTNTVNASNAGISNDTDVTISAPRQAPSLGQGAIIPSGCGAGGNAGGSNTHGAAFLGVAFTTDECYLFLLGEKFASIGMPDTACDIWLQTKSAKRAFKGKELPSCTIHRTPPPTLAPTVMHVDVSGLTGSSLVPADIKAEAPSLADCAPPPAKKKPAKTIPKAPVVCVR